jgi:hypothetical protein
VPFNRIKGDAFGVGIVFPGIQIGDHLLFLLSPDRHDLKNSLRSKRFRQRAFRDKSQSEKRRTSPQNNLLGLTNP